MECVDVVGIKEAAKKYGLPTSLVSYWNKQKEKLITSIGRKCEGSKQPQMEKTLLEWIVKRQEKQLNVTTSDIMTRAKHIAAELGIEGFIATECWVKRFKHQNGIEDPQIQPISDKNEIKDPQTCQMQSISDKNAIKDPQMQPICDLNGIKDPQMQPISDLNAIKEPQMQSISDLNGIKDPQMQPISDQSGIKDPQMQSISEEENDGHKRKQRTRTNAFKLTLVACAEKIGNRATGKKYGVAEKQIRFWRKRKDELARHLKSNRLPGAGRPAHWPELEKRLFEWTRKQEAAQKTVTFKGLKCEAMHLAKELELVNFKCSEMWMRRFRARYSIQCRRMRTVGNESKLTTIESDGHTGKVIQGARQADDVPDESSHDQQENEDGLRQSVGPSTHEICEFLFAMYHWNFVIYLVQQCTGASIVVLA